MHRCDHDHRDVGILVAKLGEQLEAVHFGHDNVAEDEVESVFAESVQGQAAIRADGAGVTLRFEERGNYFTDSFFVIHYEDFFCFHDRLPENGQLYVRDKGKFGRGGVVLLNRVTAYGRSSPGGAGGFWVCARGKWRG